MLPTETSSQPISCSRSIIWLSSSCFRCSVFSFTVSFRPCIITFFLLLLISSISSWSAFSLRVLFNLLLVGLQFKSHSFSDIGIILNLLLNTVDESVKFFLHSFLHCFNSGLVLLCFSTLRTPVHNPNQFLHFSVHGLS